MSTPNPKTRFFLVQLRSRLENYSDTSGFVIIRELDGPEIPSGVDRAGHYMVLEIVRRYKIDAIVTHNTEEFPL